MRMEWLFLARCPIGSLTTLRPIDESARKAFDRTQQYNRRALQMLGEKEIANLGNGARLVRVAKEKQEMVSVFPVAGRFCPLVAQPLAGTLEPDGVLKHRSGRRNECQSRGGRRRFRCSLVHSGRIDQPAAPASGRSPGGARGTATRTMTLSVRSKSGPPIFRRPTRSCKMKLLSAFGRSEPCVRHRTN